MKSRNEIWLQPAWDCEATSPVVISRTEVHCSLVQLSSSIEKKLRVFGVMEQSGHILVVMEVVVVSDDGANVFQTAEKEIQGICEAFH